MGNSITPPLRYPNNIFIRCASVKRVLVASLYNAPIIKLSIGNLQLICFSSKRIDGRWQKKDLIPYLAIQLLKFFLSYFFDRWVLTFLNFIWASNLLRAD